MKTFIVLIAVVAVASANTINRAAGSGWGSQGSTKPSINIDLAAAAAAAASGQAAANQALVEAAAGNIDGPAYIQSISGVLASVSQGEEVSQMVIADKPSGATSTINVADVNNLAISQDILYGSLGGSVGAMVANSAQADSSGQGSAAEEATSLVDVEVEGQQHH